MDKKLIIAVGLVVLLILALVLNGCKTTGEAYGRRGRLLLPGGPGKKPVEQPCGNGQINRGNPPGVYEDCDGTNLGDQTCKSLGYDYGTLGCSNCKFDTSGCRYYVCGNNFQEPEENCDGTDLDGKTCESSGYDYGELGCLSDCTGFDTSGCMDSECGNGIVEPGEQCEGNQDCYDIGLGDCDGNCMCTEPAPPPSPEPSP